MDLQAVLLDATGTLIELAHPVGETYAAAARSQGVDLPRTRLKDDSHDFSFSGLKSAAIRRIRERGLVGIDESQAPAAALDLAASLEKAVVDQLLGPLPELVADLRPQLITACGGVACNSLLRRRLCELAGELEVDVLLPQPPLTTDNAFMIARAGQIARRRGELHDPRRVDAFGREAWQPPGMRRAS